jgi:hypothetical protein
VHVRYVCIAQFIMSYLIHALHSVWRTIYFIPHIFSCCLEKHLHVLFGDDRKSTSGGCFFVLVCPNLSPWGQVWSYLTCYECFCIHCHLACFFCFYVLFFFNIKKKLGEKMRNFIFSFDSLSDIACVFALYLSSLCID